ncbi:hypothetical protein AAC387_Pa09g1133 [Persea americana]
MAKVNDPTRLWHFRYGHLNFNGLKTLSQKNMVTGLPQIIPHSNVCEECVVGKQHREQFPKGKEKSDAFTAFKSFKALVENEVGRAIKTLRTDSGG